MPVARTHRLRRQRTRTAQHRRGVALRRTRLSRTDAGPAGARDCRSRPAADAAQRRHDARRLRHDLPLRLQRRRARRRLAGFFDAQANARRHEAAGLFARGLGGFGAGGRGGAVPTGAGSAGAAPRQPARARLRTGGASTGGGAAAPRPAARDGLVGLRLGGPGLLDQARRTQRRRGGLRRLRRGRGGALLARRGLRRGLRPA